MPRSSLLRNNEGYMAILAALALLVLVSIVSIAASHIAGTEITMAGNETVYQRNFYLAEGAVMEAVDRLDHATDLRSSSLTWLERVAGKLDNDTVSDYWKLKDEPGAPVKPVAAAVDSNHALFIAADEGVAQGASMMMGRTTVHEFSIYGRCAWRGVSVVKVGYRAAY